MTGAELRRLADLLRDRTLVDEQIADLIGRPVAPGQASEWIASRIFEITLANNAVSPAYDGWFAAGPLSGRTVNIKWYARQESLLDMSIAPAPDYYLVITGARPGSPQQSDLIRSWVIEAVHLFSAEELLAERKARSVRLGVATSVPPAMWSAAELYPRATNRQLTLRPDQLELLRLFRPEPDPGPAPSAGPAS